MPDKYQNFDELSRDCESGIDFHISSQFVEGASATVIAPHAGKIEKGTSEIARAIAESTHSLYLFEGVRHTSNGELHITSHNFDEPNLLELLQKCDFALGVHGRRDANDTKGIYIGGLDSVLIHTLDHHLRVAGFETKTSGHNFPAKEPRNVCNRGNSHKGAQLEFSKTMRDQVVADSARLEELVAPIKAALLERLDET